MSMRVAVIGAGIGGLAAAAGLRGAGADVVVHERWSELPTGGIALSLFDNGLRALDRLGLRDAVRALAFQAPATPAGLRDDRGRWLSRFSADALASTHVVERAVLHGLLSEPVAEAIRCDSAVEAVEGGVLRLAGGTSEAGFDVVVAADGIGSAVRGSWPEDPGVQFAGYHAWRGVTSVPVPVEGVGELWGRSRRFGIAPLRDGRIYWFATQNGPRDDVPRADLDTVRARFGGWHADVTRVLEAAVPEVTQSLPIDELRPGLRTFVRGRTALLGDAAHAMTPNLGQGANQALEDAAQLTHELGPLAAEQSVSGAEVERALRRYDQRRRRRRQQVAAQARLIGRLGQTDGYVATRARDACLRLVPDRLSDAGARRVQRWDVT